MSLSDFINRLRHDYGYGVHSPLGFHLVKNVLNPPKGYAYYGYDRLEGLAASGASSEEFRRARMLLRLIADRQPVFVWCSPGVTPLYVEAIKLAGGVVRIFDGEVFPADIAKSEVILIADELPPDIDKILSMPGKTLVCFDVGKENVLRLKTMLREGIMFSTPESALIVTAQGATPMEYKVSKWRI